MPNTYLRMSRKRRSCSLKIEKVQGTNSDIEGRKIETKDHLRLYGQVNKRIRWMPWR